jgi:membrane fusion protein (multidrug efflux system)
VAKALVDHAQAEVREARTSLGLQPDDAPLKLPGDFVEQADLVQAALAKWRSSLIAAGLRDDLPSRALGKPLDLANQEKVGVLLMKSVEDLPELKLAQARIARAREALKLARLELSYAEIRAPSAGTVGKLAIHPGQQVRPGQELMTIGSPADLWIEANFAPAARERLRIGQGVALYSAAHPSQVFHGRVAGLSPTTPIGGPSPLPVRIELVGVKRPEMPLSVGLAVTSIVDLKTPPSGPLAGEPLRQVASIAKQARRPEPAE